MGENAVMVTLRRVGGLLLLLVPSIPVVMGELYLPSIISNSGYTKVRVLTCESLRWLRRSI